METSQADPESLSSYFQNLRPVIHIIDPSTPDDNGGEPIEKIDREHPPNDDDAPAMDPPSQSSLRSKFMEALAFEDPTHPAASGSSSLLHRANVQTMPIARPPPSRYPSGKEDPAVFSATQIADEGILNRHWIVKHASLLPSAIVLLATAAEDRTGIAAESTAIERISAMAEDTRANLAEKRGGSGILHVVCLVSSPLTQHSAVPPTSAERGEKLLRQHRDAAFREKIATSCRIPPHQVFILRQKDLERDEWEQRVAHSPYAAEPVASPSENALYMSPALRTLSSALLHGSARYYARLAETAERKLSAWRNRHHAGFELRALVRCVRYAIKAGVFRESEHRCASSVEGAASARHYEESYRWSAELQRRLLARGSPSNHPPPPTPGALPPDGFASPRFTESPGGGIGVEVVTLPPVMEAPPGTPASSTFRRSSSANPASSSSSSLHLQCRGIASLLNFKLLHASSSSSAPSELERQWRRHRSVFLRGDASRHCVRYGVGEMQSYAAAAEGLWRKDATLDPRSLSSEFYGAGAPWKIYGELAEAVLSLGKDPEEEEEEEGRFVGEEGWRGWDRERNPRAAALEYVLHALALWKENDSICQSVSEEDAVESTVKMSNVKLATPNAAVRLHYFAGRLFMSLNDSESALPHFRIAVERTKKWPSLHLTMRRALLQCESQRSSKEGEIVESSIKMLLEPSACAILSASEIAQAQTLLNASSDRKEVVWKDDYAGVTTPPFDFCVTFLESTHATSGDTVLACISVQSRLSFPVYIESIQLNTTAGDFGIADLRRRASRAALRSWRKGTPATKGGGEAEFGMDSSNVGTGMQLNSNGLVYFFTEVKLPSSLVETAWGKTAADLSKFHPKNGKLCNMGFCVAAGNICKVRWTDESNKIMLDGKPVAVSDLSDEIVSFFGGVPLVCHGLTFLFKPSSSESCSLLKLRVDRQHFLSPLGRTDAPQYLMEECNYTAHSWSRPAHHPLHLGPRCLRVLGPRPHMEVTNLTDPITGGDVIQGTVNRIVIQLQAGDGYDCWDVKLRLRCSGRSEKITPSLVDAASEGEAEEAEQDNQSLFVQMSLDAGTTMSTEEGIALPQGWEPRSDVVNGDESQDPSTLVASHLKAGKGMLLPLDLFRPLNISSDHDADSTAISTSYEVILTFREVRVEDGGDDCASPGNQVTVVLRGSVNWIKPFSADFTVVDEQKSFPCGVTHPSNMTNFVASPSSRMEEEADILSADGERVRMRFVLRTKGLGSNVAANVLSVVNEIENNPKQKELYSSSESATFLPHAKRGSKLCMSYTVITQRHSSHSNEHVTMPLGVISVNWKPVGLALSSHFIPMLATTDEHGTAHGPLCLPDITPMIFYGPQCQVLNAPFTARILKCPSPKVGIPFRVTYQIRNKTAKCQTLSFSLKDAGSSDDATLASSEHLMITGKVQGQVQISPFEEKSFPFTFMSMMAGKIRCPSFCVSSGRHHSWVINENAVKERYFFIMP